MVDPALFVFGGEEETVYLMPDLWREGEENVYFFCSFLGVHCG